MNELKAYEFCEETIKLKNQIEKNYIELCARLHKIKTERLYEGSYTSWNLFVEEMKIDQNKARYMVEIYEKFVLTHKISPARIVSAGGWSVVAELLPIAETKQDAEDALDYATGALKKDVRIYVHQKRYGKVSEKMCLHKNTYRVEICRDCGDRHEIV